MTKAECLAAALILVPTRELALQTSQVCKELGKHMGVQVTERRPCRHGICAGSNSRAICAPVNRGLINR